MKNKVFILVDVLLGIVLMALIGFERVGRSYHEWIGLTFLFLLIIHLVQHHRWIRSINKGNFTLIRLVMMVVNGCMMVTMILLWISSLWISQEIFSFWPITQGTYIAQRDH